MNPGDGHRQAFEAASRTAAAAANPLLELDEWLGRNEKGTALIRGPKSARESVLELVAARCASRGRTVVHARTSRSFLSECFRMLATPAASASGGGRGEGMRDSTRMLARTLRDRRAVVVTPLPDADTHEAGVIHRFVQEASPLVVFFAESSTLIAGEFDIELDLAETLSEADRNLWFQTFAAKIATVQTWASLGSWAARASAIEAVRAELSAEAAAALVALVRVDRVLPVEVVQAAFGDALTELAREGYLRVSGGISGGVSGGVSGGISGGASEVVETTALATSFASLEAGEGALVGRASLALAGSLATSQEADWLEAAARVFATESLWDRASETISRARDHAWDDEARIALDRRWFDHVRVLALDTPRLLDEARVALAEGNNDLACAWADLAASTTPECVEAELLLARAKIASGDARSAEAILTRLTERTLQDDSRAVVFAELAEARYLLGDMSGARMHAARVTAESGPASTAARLDARNTLGKVLLAESSFDLAEAHFLRDEITARESGLDQSMWRARVNRAVAVLSRGDVALSERILEEVARTGRAKNDPRLLAFAVDNLAVCAMKKREYARALTLLDEAVALRMRLGERAKAARLVGNLAELRLRLGLLEHADHALAFGARLVAQTQLPARRGQLALVAARVALARGRIDEARAKVELAKRELRIASEKEYQNEARVVEARVAFEEGRVEAMHRLLDGLSGDERATEPEVLAEVLLLRAQATRAEGQPCGHLLVRVLDVAEAAQADETAIEAHGLMAEVRAAEGDPRSAVEHRRFAVSLRDRVASELPAEVAKAYRGRRDFAWMEERPSASAAKSSSCGGPRASERLSRTERDVTDAGPSTQRSRSGLLLPAPLTWAEGDESSDAIEEPRVRRPSDVVRRPLKAVPPVGPSIVGEHPKMRALLAAVSKVARAPGTVLIQGESGTGKELVATAIHQWSPRAEGPCITVNCAALAEPLLLSELFGHEKGAFTGAVARHRGRFELAEGGTLFLDEIGDISPRTQVALLRVLQEKTYERVGGTGQLRANVRIVCATHKNLRAMVDRGEFREDLYYRLAEITVEVPALRDRASDIPALAQSILDRVASEHRVTPAKLSADALGLLSKYAFPGNVRELENILRSVSLLEDVPVITASELLLHHPALRAADVRRDSQRAMSVAGVVVPGKSQEAATGQAFETVRSGEMSLPSLKRQIERECIGRALVETGGNITKAAELLGMKRPRLSQLVKQYELGEDDAAEDQ